MIEARLNGSPEIAAEARGASRRYPRTCCECGQSYGAANAEAEFCGTPCRQRFNNRRAQRGAELYDLLMAHRFNRPLAKALGVLALINRLASIFREEDRREREGRPSWRPPSTVIARRPYLRAQRLRAGPRVG